METNKRNIEEAINLLRNEQIHTDGGMSQELFLLISGLIPIPNVDLLIVNQKNQILLSWREDSFFESSWHIPGGCMHYGESFENCLQATAKRELGVDITWDEEPIAVRNVIRGMNEQQLFPRERGHNVAILFRCFLCQPLDESLLTDTSGLQNGKLKWFDKLPQNFMTIQHVYDEVLTQWI